MHTFLSKLAKKAEVNKNMTACYDSKFYLYKTAKMENIKSSFIKSLVIYITIVYTPAQNTQCALPLLLGRLNLLPNFQKGVLDGISTFRGGLMRKTEITFLRGLQFLDKKYTKIWNI